MATILVTGGSGFVGGHVVLQLLAAGHDVRTTVRSLAKEPMVRATLTANGADDGRLTFFAADLEKDAGWAEAVSGCDYVHHVASPFPLANPKQEDELIRPAVDGTLRVLKAARDAGVKRVVLTSSIAAVAYGQPDRSPPYTEEDWTNVSGVDVTPYVKSKTLAERAAWKFIADDGNGLELATIQPGAIMGPALDDNLSSSVALLGRMLRGDMPGLPRLYFGVIDVRDVADLHIRAMTDPAAAGQRFLAITGNSLSLKDMAIALRNGLGDRAAKVPTRVLPDFMVRIVGLFDAEVRPTIPSLGLVRNASADKARRLLGWQPRPAAKAICAAGESLIRLGLA